MPDYPVAYFITFRCYGTWLHGDPRGSTDPTHRGYGAPRLYRDDFRTRFELRQFKNSPVKLSPTARSVVERTLAEVCQARGWQLHAANARTNHVHLVVSAVEAPELVMNSLKSWCTRKLRAAGLAPAGTRVWSRHGSTAYLWDEQQVEQAWRYVVHGQDPERG